MTKPYKQPSPDYWAQFFDGNQKLTGCGDLRKHYVGGYLKGAGFGTMLSSVIGSAMPAVKSLGAELATKTLADALSDKQSNRDIKPNKTRKVTGKRKRNDIFKKNGTPKTKTRKEK